jgi:general secretion pathway protein G
VSGSASCRARGFTLIELLVVMMIIGALLSIAVPRYFRSLDRARETVLRQDLAIMREALDKYSADLGHPPESLADLVEHKYIRALPVDPITKSSETWVMVQSDDANAPGILDVQSGAPGSAQDGTEFHAW